MQDRWFSTLTAYLNHSGSFLQILVFRFHSRRFGENGSEIEVHYDISSNAAKVFRLVFQLDLQNIALYDIQRIFKYETYCFHD